MKRLLSVLGLLALAACGQVDAAQRGIGSGVFSTGACLDSANYSRQAPSLCLKTSTAAPPVQVTLNSAACVLVIGAATEPNPSMRAGQWAARFELLSGSTAAVWTGDIGFYSDAGCTVGIPVNSDLGFELHAPTGTVGQVINVPISVYNNGGAVYVKFTSDSLSGTGAVRSVNILGPYSFND